MGLLTVNNLFSEGCVIQRNQAAAIWGTAAEGAAVQITFAGHALYASAPGGVWEAALPAMPAGGPHILRITSGDEVLEVGDILTGDVFIAGGQSNMEWPLKHTAGGRAAVETADRDRIRFYNVLKILFPGELEEAPGKFPRTSAWRPATSDHAGEFSAVAYYFAREIQDHLDVPVGIIECNLGGSSASAWVSRETLEKDADLRSYLDEYEQIVAGMDLDEYIERNMKARRLAVRFLPIIDKVLPDDERPTFVPDRLPARIQSAIDAIIQPGPRCLFGRPAGLYENMLMTIVPYTVCGVIFYQGEADDGKARIYGKLFSALIGNWRMVFRNPELPFLFVQLAAYGREGYPEGHTYALIREQQARVAESVPHTGMAVAMDVGSEIDVHPRRKQPVGHRLAVLAFAHIFGEAAEYSGPLFKSMKIDGNQIQLYFDHAESGLVCPDGELKGFRICGSNRRYYPALARIVGLHVELCSEEVARPAAASYGWANYMEVNLYNGAGLPAVPFRTDRFS